jgi:hypothetical protein
MTAMIVLLLAVPWCEAARRWQAEPLGDVEATVISLRRYEHSTDLQVLNDEGQQEWLDVNREQGLEVREGQRIEYSRSSEPSENMSLGMVRYGVEFRILSPEPDKQIYRETSPEGTPVFTDNPTSVPSSDPDKLKNSASREQGFDEVIIADPEETRRKEAIMEGLYRYSEQASRSKPERRAKRAKPKQY